MTGQQRVTDEQLKAWTVGNDWPLESLTRAQQAVVIADLRESRAEVERLQAHAAGLEVSLEERRAERDASRAREAALVAELVIQHLRD